MNSSDQRLPLYQRLRDELMAKIASRVWQPDTPIPTEIELTKAYGVAIGTVRKAVELLVADGVLERNQGRGTYVRRPSFKASPFRFFRHQTGGEGNRVPESRIVGRHLTVPPEHVAKSLGLNKRAKAIRLDRLRLMDGHPVLLEEIWLPFARFSALMTLELADFGNLLYPLFEERCGQTVASAQETLTAESADAVTAAHLGITQGKPVIVIERLAFGYDQKPLEWRRSLGPADGFRYRVDIR